MLPWMRDKLFGTRQKLVNVWNRRLGVEGLENFDVCQEQQTNMFVSDSSIFPTNLVKLSVISIEGNVFSIEASADLTVDKIKTMALGHFYNSLESAKLVPNFKLVSVSQKRSLEGAQSISQEGLESNDELLLVERRPCSDQKIRFTEEALRGPTEEEIIAATQSIQEKNKLKLHLPLECTADFQSEIRKILISLVEASARLFTPSAKAEEVFILVRERLDARRGTEPDPHAVHQLAEMGFSEAAAARALRVNQHNETNALEWLLDRSSHQGTNEQTDESSSTHASSTNHGSSSSKAVVSQTLPNRQSRHGQETMVEAVAALLDSFRAGKRLDFKPDPRALQTLVEMGFNEDDTRQALQITGNNQSAACDWLLGERRPSLEDLDMGLDVEGPIYKAIMANPAIRLSLTNPKMLFAFLSILETPNSANMWINDPDAAPVLSQIFKIYHAEKHALQMNRYVEQQQQQP